MSLARKLDQTVSIYRGTPSRAATGTVTRALPAAVTATCAGRVIPGRGGGVKTAEGEFHQADAELLVPAGTDLRPRDASTDGRADWVKVDGVTYLVLHGRDPGGAGRLLHFLLQRVA